MTIITFILLFPQNCFNLFLDNQAHGFHVGINTLIACKQCLQTSPLERAEFPMSMSWMENPGNDGS